MRLFKAYAFGALALSCMDPAHAAPDPAKPVRVPGLEAPMNWEQVPLDFQLTRDGIRIAAAARTDRYVWSGGGHAPDNAPRLVFTTSDSEFVFSAAVSHKFASKYDAGGLYVEADSQHWFKFAFERDYTGAHRIISVITNDFSDDANSVEVAADTAHLRIARLGDAFALYASKAGKEWFLVRIFRLQHRGPIKVGLIAQCPEGPGTSVTFSDLKYSASRIQDIWARE